MWSRVININQSLTRARHISSFRVNFHIYNIDRVRHYQVLFKEIFHHHNISSIVKHMGTVCDVLYMYMTLFNDLFMSYNTEIRSIFPHPFVCIIVHLNLYHIHISYFSSTNINICFSILLCESNTTRNLISLPLSVDLIFVAQLV